GGVLVTAAFAGYAAVAGVLRLAWWGFVLVNIGYTRAPTILSSWQLVAQDYSWSLVVVLLGLAGLLVLSVRAVARARRTAGAAAVADHSLLVLGSACLVAVLWTCSSVNGGADLYVVLPFAALGVAGLWLEV